MATNVTLTAGTLPAGYCLSTLQQFYSDIIALTLAQIPGTYSLFNFGASVPDSADQDKPWIRTNADGSLDGLYTFNGVWVRPHVVPYGSSVRQIWVGTEADLWAFDGGDGSNPATSPPTDTTGAMWVVDTDFTFKFPVGVGINATAYDGNPNSSIAVKGTGGEERHTLTEAELAAHHHFLANVDSVEPMGDLSATTHLCRTANKDSNSFGYSLSGTATAATIGLSDDTGDGKSHLNMPPFIGVYFIKRSARKYHVVS